MYVSTETQLREDALRKKLLEAVGGGLEYAAERRPPKFWLRRFPGTLPVAAEVVIYSEATRSTLELRLMWGPMPAVVPRLVAAVGALSAATVLALGEAGLRDIALAGVLVVIPGVALLYQRAGEHQLQSKLTRVLGAQGFLPGKSAGQ